VSAGSQSDRPPKGVRLGVDVGTVRLGVAISDPRGVLATPVKTVARKGTGGTDLDELAALVEEHEVVEVVVGLPRTLRGADGPAATAAREFADRLAAQIAPVPVVLVDERLTTVAADRILADRGIRGPGRRKVVDQVAAMAILQSRLDALAGATGD
jgi:putative holliday junction resolvase